MAKRPLVVEGWFNTLQKGQPNLDRTFLDGSAFKLSARRFELEDLKVLNIHKITGTVFNPIYVTAVINLKGTLEPFFIRKEKAEKLQRMQDILCPVPTL